MMQIVNRLLVHSYFFCFSNSKAPSVMALNSDWILIANYVQASELGFDQEEKEVQQDGKAEVDKLNSTTPLIVNLEPVREEQVQNAVTFFSSPSVRGSPVIYRRSFLEQNGLTKEEIDEAFRRVPASECFILSSHDPSPTAVASSASRDGGVKSPSNNQLQASTQTLQPSASAPTAPTTIVSSTGTLKGSEFHWSGVLLAVGLLSISGAVTAFIIKEPVQYKFL
ncbi:unnamed protein product [Citrullus colocynthis]|uniref:Peroxisomal membrane protein PEX14 n=1 Tax=Citrullus colocynthis TaxID=252529 RepID=A0ABP0XX69_9ROSI